MLAIGCLVPIVLLAAGTGIGTLIGGTKAAEWGAGIGFVVGCIGFVVLIWGFERLKDRE